MSTLVENVAKVTAAHAALKEAIAAKGVTVPDGTKLTGMPALVEQIQTGGGATEPNMTRAVFYGDTSTTMTVPLVVVVDMSAATDLSNCFNNCAFMSALQLPDGFGSAATVMNFCFYSCGSLKSLILPPGFGSAATTMRYFFYGCSNLATLHLPDGFGAVAENLYSCFDGCWRLTTLHLPDGFGSVATELNGCFSGCGGLTTLHLPDGFGAAANSLGSCFSGCRSLSTITGNPNFKVSVSFSTSTKLTHDSLMVVINGLQTVTTTQTLTLGSANLAKLTDEEKKVATDRGWTLA